METILLSTTVDSGIAQWLDSGTFDSRLEDPMSCLRHVEHPLREYAPHRIIPSPNPSNKPQA